MKRKGVAPQHGACDVWLDASVLKKRKKQILTPLKFLNRRSLYIPPTRSPPVRTKQTTISTFFSALRPGERSSTSRRIPVVASISAPLPKGGLLEKQIQDLSFPQPSSAPVQSDATLGDRAVEREPPSEHEDLFSGDCVELPEHPCVTLSPLKERNVVQDSWKNPKWLPFPSGENSSDGSLMEELENVDPQLSGCSTSLRGFNQSGAGLRPNGEVFLSGSEVGHKESHTELLVPLFTQDSEGYKVISHRFAHKRGEPLLEKKRLWNSPRKGSFGHSQKFHYDSLFKEDSDGNVVLKY